MSPLELFDLVCDHVHDVSPAARHVLLALARHVGADGTCFPSQARLAEVTGYSRRTIVTAIADLEQAGHLSIRSRAQKVRSRGLANVYALHPVKRVHEVKADHQVQHDHHVQETTSPGATASLHQVKQLHTKVPSEGAQEGAQPVRFALTPPERDEVPEQGQAKSGERASQNVEAAKPGTRRAKAKSAQPAPPGHAEVVACWFAEHERVRGVRPTFGAREGKLVAGLLERLGSADEACAVIRRAFADPFWASKITLSKLVAEPDPFRGTTPRSGGARALQPLPAEQPEWMRLPGGEP